MFYLVRNKDRQNVPLTSVSYFLLMINQKFQLLVILKTLAINDSCSVPIGIQDKLRPIAKNVEICQNVCIDVLDKYAPEKQKYVLKSCNYVCSL